MSTTAENKPDFQRFGKSRERTITLKPLANKAPAGSSTPFLLPEDGWFQMAPYGEFPHHTGPVQVIDERAVDSMVARIHAEMPGGFPGLLLDWEHQSHEPNGSTAAAGWIEDLEKRTDGLWARVRWTPEGKADIAGGRYRFWSPSWLVADVEWIGGSGDRLRPLRLADAGLTNTPNLTGLVPLSNRQAPASGNPQQTTTADDTTTDMANPDYKALLTDTLGLPATATDEQITATRPTVIANRDKGAKYDALKTDYDALRDSQADSDLDAAGITDPEERKGIKPVILDNRAGALILLANVAKARGNKAAASLTNRATARTPGQGATTASATTTPDAKTQGQLQQEAIGKIKLENRGISNEAAYTQAKAQHPDLFRPAAAAAE